MPDIPTGYRNFRYFLRVAKRFLILVILILEIVRRFLV